LGIGSPISSYPLLSRNDRRSGYSRWKASPPGGAPVSFPSWAAAVRRVFWRSSSSRMRLADARCTTWPYFSQRGKTYSKTVLVFLQLWKGVLIKARCTVHDLTLCF